MYHFNNKSVGFTLVELLIVMTILPLLVAGFIFVIFTTLDNTRRSNFQFSLTSQAQDAAYTIERDVRLSRSYETTITTPFSDAYGQTSNGATWTYNGASNSANSRALILAVPATTSASLSGDRGPVYTNQSVIDGKYNCTDQIAYNAVLTNRVIYFVRNSTLYRRILTDRTTPTCSATVRYQQQSCPPELRSSWDTGVCKTADEAIATNINVFRVDYFEQRAVAPLSGQYVSGDPAVLDQADDVAITVGTTRQFAGQPLSALVTLRITKANEVIQ